MQPDKLNCCGLFLVSVLLAGCSAPKVHDRFRDAGEIVDLGITTGPGVEVGARVTNVAQIGFGGFEGTTRGWIQGRAVEIREQRSEMGASLFHVYEYRRDGNGHLLDVHHPRWADPGFVEFPLSHQVLADRQPWDLGFTMHLGWVGVNVAVHPAEFFDFLFGWFGYDMRGDDVHSVSLEQLRHQARSVDAEQRAEAFDALLRRGEKTYGYPIYTIKDIRTRAQRDAMDALGGSATIN